MKSLILFSILVAAVKARKVFHDQGILIENYIPQAVENYHNEYCENTIPYYTSQLTVTSTMLWLNSVPVTSLVLGSTWYTVFVTTTEYATTTGTDYEPPCTITALPAINSKWVTVTETETEVYIKTYTNVVPATYTTTINAEAIEVSAECSTYTIDGETTYFTRTTYWTHTQTMHDKVMVGTEVQALVTSTYLVSNIEAESYTKYVTRTETATSTKFYTSTHSTASTLWVTHAVKEDCYKPDTQGYNG